MKKLVSNITMIALALAMLIQPLAPLAKANTNSPLSATTGKSLPVGNSARAVDYPNAKIRNRTIYPATGTIKYASMFCKNDYFSVPAGVLQKDGSIKEGYWEASSRGVCLITGIDAQLQGAGKGVTSYSSSGTSYGNFILQGTQTDYRVWSDHELAAENAKSKEGKSPGFYITNKTKWPVSIALSQVGCLYYETIMPGKVFKRNTGAVWFTIKANVQADGKEQRTDWDCVAPVAAVVGAALFAAATAGTGAFLAAPAMGGALTAIATSTAVTVSGAAVAAGAGSAASGLAIAVGKIVAENGSANLVGQYAGPEWPFRCDQMPTYEIHGGPDQPIKTADGGFIQDVGTPLKIYKVNDCGDSMMATTPAKVPVAAASSNPATSTPRGSTVYTGCGYTYKTKLARDTQCGGGEAGRSIWIGDGVDESKMTRGQIVYTGCGYTYASKAARDTQCGGGEAGTTKWIPE